MTAAAEDQNEGFGKLLQERFDTRRIGTTGAAEHLDKELDVLHRSVRVINSELMEIEADQTHVPQLLEDLGLIQSNIVKTPIVKLIAIEAEAIENSPNLEGEQATTLRRSMRCAYLVQDRVDICEAILHERCRNRMQVTHCSTPRKSQAERTWKCTWTAIGLETRWRVGARLERLCGEDDTCSDTAEQYNTSLDSTVQK